MTKIEFSERLEKYHLKRERDKKLFLLFALICFFMGYLSHGSNISFVVYILGIGWLGKSIMNWSGTEETELLIAAVQLLSQNKNT